MSAQSKAANWHWFDFCIASIMWVTALVGVVGHYKLRKEYNQEMVNAKVNSFINHGR